MSGNSANMDVTSLCFNGYTDTCFSSIDFSLITFNWFHTIFVDTMPSDVSQLYSLSVSVYLQG